MEVNMTQLGWNEDIVTYNNAPVVNPLTGEEEKYRRDMTYVQIPIFAHLSWGKERNGVCGFVNPGPQIGFMLSEKTDKNYEIPFTEVNFLTLTPDPLAASAPSWHRRRCRLRTSLTMA